MYLFEYYQVEMSSKPVESGLKINGILPARCIQHATYYTDTVHIYSLPLIDIYAILAKL